MTPTHKLAHLLARLLLQGRDYRYGVTVERCVRLLGVAPAAKAVGAALAVYGGKGCPLCRSRS